MQNIYLIKSSGKKKCHWLLTLALLYLSLRFMKAIKKVKTMNAMWKGRFKNLKIN